MCRNGICTMLLILLVLGVTAKVSLSMARGKVLC
jgi:hypothetical protein